MELIQYYRLLRRWLWLIILAAFVAGSLSFISRVTQPAQYQTHAKIAIGGYLDAPNPNSQEIRTGIDLAQTYAELVRTYNVLNRVVETLTLPFGVDKLNAMIDTRIIAGTSLLEISVTYTDPVLASDITNEVTVQLIAQSPTNLTPEQQNQVDLLDEEIEAQRNELQTLRNQLNEITISLAVENISADARNFLLEQRSGLVDQINVASSNIAQFTNTIASFQARTNSIEIVETSRIPTSPIGSSLFSTVMLGATVGGGLAFGAVLSFEYLNDTFRNADEVTQTLKLPVLGVISQFGKKSDSYSDRLISSLPAFSKTSEEYRTLRTNLLYTSDKENRVFVICSASPEEGKTVTAANLAVSLGLSGLNILLIDADLRRPKIHEAFNIDNFIGLSSLLAQHPQSEFVMNDVERTQPVEPFGSLMNEDSWRRVTQRTLIPNLNIIPSGFSPVNPSELLGSALMKRWMAALRNAPQLDVIVFDSPPVLAVSDSSVLAAAMGAKVVLVIQANHTRRNVAIKAKERFEQVGAEIVGVVVNNANLRDEDYYGYNYSYYYNTPTQVPQERTDSDT
jgi:capsular exopolysaccharide synthesis family protein